MSKTVDFRIRGDDPTLAKTKAMLEGLANHTGDSSLKIAEHRILAVTTERDDVAALLTIISKSGNGHLVTPKKKYNRKPKEPEFTAPIEAA